MHGSHYYRHYPCDTVTRLFHPDLLLCSPFFTMNGEVECLGTPHGKVNPSWNWRRDPKSAGTLHGVGDGIQSLLEPFMELKTGSKSWRNPSRNWRRDSKAAGTLHGIDMVIRPPQITKNHPQISIIRFTGSLSCWLFSYCIEVSLKSKMLYASPWNPSTWLPCAFRFSPWRIKIAGASSTKICWASI